ncbi:hypothetical protein [Amnibacterium kyonggiense]|uniref:Signal transduction histidine kinase n=1 Tax=Amnibacterium kyonggiense TaxID=595671 RepID=A0A4R7FFM1_9MICO|nr:hypothetical protein [Amnibacterium kyonggiense]TDS75001.1 signal transduction histidine kinase [Amnibacterium kyonggiense]
MTTDLRGVSAHRVGALRFQKYLGVIVAAFGLLYALQTLDGLVADWPTMAGPVGGAAVALVAGSVLLGTVAGLVPSRARSLFLGASILFCAAAAVWPFSISGPVPDAPMPWFIALLPVVAAYLAVAFRRAAAPIWAAMLLSAAIATVLVLRGGLGIADAVANGLFGIAVSTVLVILIAAVRRGVERADLAQQTALAGYGRSRLDDATEHERVRTDALVHDSVLTTFLAAAAARDPEAEELARRMAANALRVLAHVSRAGDTGPAVPFGKVLGDAADRFAGVLPGWDVQDLGSLHDLVLPVEAGEALVDALLLAVTAGSLHTDEATSRTIRMSELGPDGIRIVLEDDGAAFDPAEAGHERAALLRDAAELMRSVDGRADVRAGSAGGTAVVLSWGSVVVSGTAIRPERAEVSA